MPAAAKSRLHPLMATAIIAVLVIALFYAFTAVWTRKLWFDSLDFTVVFGTQLATQGILFAAFFLVMTVVVALNMWLAFRSRPLMRRTGQSEILDRYRDALERHARIGIAVPAVFFGFVSGVSATGNAMMYLAWANRHPFGDADPYFGLDSSFYVFEYPVWRDILSFAMSTVILSGLAAAAIHFAVGNLMTGRPARKKGESSPARVQLSILAAVGLVVFGLQTLLDRYGLLLSDGTVFTGLQYTDDNARATAKIVMAVIVFICAGLFAVNTRLTKWLTPVAGLVLMVVSGLIVSMAYPAVIQTFQVRPNEPDKERPYIEKHIAATRHAFGIDGVDIQAYPATTTASAGQLKNDAEVLPGIRLIDPAVVSPTFEQLQQIRGYYTFAPALDVDRYVIKGTETDAVVAAREIKQSGIQDPTWNTVHTVYTHGYGMVAAYGNRRQAGGAPDWIEKNLPPEGVLGDYEGRVYFGEQSTQFAVVGRLDGQAPIEFDTPGGCGADQCFNVYAGTGGVPIGNMFTRLLYAAQFGDINLVLSDRVNEASKLLYDRTPQQRVAEVAPWLTLDQNIYPAVADGRLVWIVDCYTSSGNFPNSERVALPGAQSSLTGRVNYMRNSVKAVVDATNGTVDLYAWDASDPILQTFAAVFPGTVKSRDQITPDLLAHMRYPEDLFNVQRKVLARYHMTNAMDWYQQSDLWQIPQDPVNRATDGDEPPYYLSIKLPGDTAPIFSLTGVFVPNKRANLASYLAVVAEATSPDYGKLRVLRMPDTQQIAGPGQTLNDMTTNESVAAVLRPYLNQGAAEASYGNLLTLPIGGGLLYVLPVYTQKQASAGSGAYPVLTFVVARFGDAVAVGSTLQQALDSVFRGDAGASTGEQAPGTANPPPTEPTTPGTPAPTASPTPGQTAAPTTGPTAPPTRPSDADVNAAGELLTQAQNAFVAADAALKAGDLAEYQKQVEVARTDLAQALQKMGR